MKAGVIYVGTSMHNAHPFSYLFQMIDHRYYIVNSLRLRLYNFLLLLIYKNFKYNIITYPTLALKQWTNFKRGKKCFSNQNSFSFDEFCTTLSQRKSEMHPKLIHLPYNCSVVLVSLLACSILCNFSTLIPHHLARTPIVATITRTDTIDLVASGDLVLIRLTLLWIFRSRTFNTKIQFISKNTCSIIMRTKKFRH